MAQVKRAKPAGRPKSAAKSIAERAIRIRVNVSDDVPVYYVNHLEVGHSLHEFALSASRIPTTLTEDRRKGALESGELVVVPELQLVFSPIAAKSLIGVLEVQIAAYESRFGPIMAKGGETNE